MRWLVLTLALLSCASPATPPPDPNGDPIALLPEKRRVLYWKKGCDTPEEQVAEVLDTDAKQTILWKAQCADGRVLRCSFRRLLKCRWDKTRPTSTATSARLD
jgi:hypothetical protein